LETNLKLLLIVFLLAIFFHNSSAQNWFPLEVGNRWDYFVQIDIPGSTYYDTLSVEIVDTILLSNGLEYFEFSTPLPLWNYQPYPKFARVEDSEIYFFDEEDSTDCFAFRFDLPVDSFYVNCKGDQLIMDFINYFNFFGVDDSLQEQIFSWPYIYQFSKNFGLFSYGRVILLSKYFYELKGCIISGTTYGNLLVSVGDENYLPNVFSLSQNYPNPFNPNTSIRFTISDLQFTILKVYDILGNEIATLVNEEKTAGEYEVKFNGTGLPSGIYFYQLRTGNYIETKKMVLLK
jgi:Secretion system C-terminal sorting domain